MSDQTNIGQLAESDAKRDAIHVACAPVTSDGTLHAGDHIGFVEAGNTDKVSTNSGNPIGIVDPFLKSPVRPGQRFWMLLYPKTVTGLRHEWTHPAFTGPAATEVDVSKAWLRNIAERCGVSYERMIGAVDGDDYINMGDNEDYKDVIDDQIDEFNRHCSIVLGREVSAYPFSCSC